MFCKYCGNEIPDEAKFCSACGKPVVDTKEEKEALTETVSQDPPEKSKGKKHTLRNAIIAIIVCVAVVVVLLVVFLPGERDADTNGMTEATDADANEEAKATETVYKDSEIDSYTEFFYDENNLLTLEIQYDKPGGEISYETNYSYDENGNMTSKVETDPEGEIVLMSKDTYDENGNKTRSVLRLMDGTTQILIPMNYTYDEDGNMISQVETDMDGEIEDTTKYAYDENGNMISKVYTESDGEIIDTTKYTYDENGNMISEVYTETDGENNYSTNYTYDENGRMISAVKAQPNGSIIYTTNYTYDENGNMISEIATDPEGKEVHRYEYTYKPYEALINNSSGEDATDSVSENASDSEDDNGSGLLSNEDSVNSVLNGYIAAKDDFDMAAMTNYWPDYQFDNIMALMGYSSKEEVIDVYQSLYNQMKEELDQLYGDFIIDAEIVEIKDVDINEIIALLQGNNYVEPPEIQKAKRAEVKYTIRPAKGSDEVYNITTSFVFLAKIDSTWYVVDDQELN